MLLAISTGLLGILGSFLGGWMTLRAQRESAQRTYELALLSRSDSSVDVQRAACADFLVAIDDFIESARDLWARQDGADAELIAASYETHARTWQTVCVALPTFQLSAPLELSDAAVELKKRAGCYSDELDSRFHHRRWSRSRLETLRDELIAARHDFMADAQRAVAPTRLTVS